MQWHKPLYVGEKAQKQKKKIIRAVKYRKFMAEAHIITLSINQEELLDIYPVYTLMHKQFPKKALYIVGIAADKEEAFQIVEQLIDEVYQETNTVDIRSWLLHK